MTTTKFPVPTPPAKPLVAIKSVPPKRKYEPRPHLTNKVQDSLPIDTVTQLLSIV